MTSTENKEKIIGLVCERSVELKDQLDEKGCLKDDPNVQIIKVPCSGMIQPIMLETALKNGADGTFACGCRIGDCHYREGNKFLRERLLGTRMPKIKPSTDQRRIQAYWLSVLEYEKLQEMVGDFQEYLKTIDSSDAATGSASQAVEASS
ncbi:MAG: hydrogenase iron-sulfur subunit [Vampirovibrio sp.]|nr:hydrogenase iron-sulfur subunit [Vampirovibrio sp.]